jgi:hypothetical protein
MRTYQEHDFAAWLSFEGRRRSEGRPQARETMAPLAASLVERPGGRRTPASLGCSAPSQGAWRTASRSAGHLRHWCPAPPGAPFPRSEGDEKGKGRARQPEKAKWPGSIALASKPVPLGGYARVWLVRYNREW